MSIREGGSIERREHVPPTLGVPFHPSNFCEDQPVAVALYGNLYSHLTPYKGDEGPGASGSGGKVWLSVRLTALRLLTIFGSQKNTQSKAKMPEDVGDTRDESEETEEGLDMTEDLAHDGNEEPRLWRNSLLLVCDPFIFAKVSDLHIAFSPQGFPDFCLFRTLREV